MITYTLRFTWALIFQIIWNTFTITSLFYLILFDISALKQEIKNDNDFFIYLFYYKDCDCNDWFTFSKEGEWKSIFHWAFKIKN
jgi:hypothetical protein